MVRHDMVGARSGSVSVSVLLGSVCAPSVIHGRVFRRSGEPLAGIVPRVRYGMKIVTKIIEGDSIIMKPKWAS